MNAWDRYFHGRYLALRPYLLRKLFLVTVAFDTWLLMIGHAGRYGVAHFNVAHISLLDRLAPVPSPGLYVGVLLLSGWVALGLALIEPTAVGMAVLWCLYTYSWAMSMLDSYQHHYFVSLVLLCMACFPRVRSSALKTPTALTRGAGFPVLAATYCIVYSYAALAKLDSDFLAGHTLQRIARNSRVWLQLCEFMQGLGVPRTMFWMLAARSVIPLELIIAVGYACAPLQDVALSQWPRRVSLLALGCAVALHASVETMQLSIGWFSYYMLLSAAVFLLPARALAPIARAITRSAGWTRCARIQSAHGGDLTWQVWLAFSLSAVVCVSCAYLLDLPGAIGAACAAVLGLCFVVSVQPAHSALRTALAGGCAALLMLAAVTLSSVRWDFYRFLGGDLQRRGENSAALAAYLKSERYAPKEKSRTTRIDELRRKLKSSGDLTGASERSAD
jgi:hypothetical protein